MEWSSLQICTKSTGGNTFTYCTNVEYIYILHTFSERHSAWRVVYTILQVRRSKQNTANALVKYVEAPDQNLATLLYLHFYSISMQCTRTLPARCMYSTGQRYECTGQQRSGNTGNGAYAVQGATEINVQCSMFTLKSYVSIGVQSSLLSLNLLFWY